MMRFFCVYKPYSVLVFVIGWSILHHVVAALNMTKLAQISRIRFPIQYQYIYQAGHKQYNRA
jgi:hypothetical protein